MIRWGRACNQPPCHHAAMEYEQVAAAVSGVLLLDVILFYAIFYGYRRLRPALAVYLARSPRS